MGHSVLVPCKLARPNKEGIISGVVDLPKTASNLNIIFENSEGEVLHQDTLGMQKAGLVGFEWKDLPDDIRNLIKNYTFNKEIIVNYIASIISNTYPLNLYSSLLTRKSAYKYEKSDFNEDLEKFVQSILDKLDLI